MQSDSSNSNFGGETGAGETTQFDLATYDQANEKLSASISTFEHIKQVVKDWRHYESDVETCDTEDNLDEDYSVEFLDSTTHDNIQPHNHHSLRNIERKAESWRRLAIADFCKVPDFFDA